MIDLPTSIVQRPCNAGSTGGATGGATSGQRPGNGGVQLSPYTPGVAPRPAGGATPRVITAEHALDATAVLPGA